MKSRLPGLAEMLASGKPHECPFCGDPRKARTPARQPGESAFKRGGPGRRAPGCPEGYYLTCGDEVCAAAYQRCWKRDQTTKRNQMKNRDLSVAGARTAA